MCDKSFKLRYISYFFIRKFFLRLLKFNLDIEVKEGNLK